MSIALDETHQFEGAQPMFHRRRVPFGFEILGVADHAIDVVDGRHVVGVILVIGLRTAHPP